jgi:L-asparaginase
VVNYRCGEEIRYWYWDERMRAPELRVAAAIEDSSLLDYLASKKW